jgi:hypothetical protein
MTTDMKPPMSDKEAFMRVALAPEPEQTPAGNPKFLGPPAAVVAFSDWNYYYTKDVLEWCSNTDPANAVRVPSGFVTNGWPTARSWSM